MADNNIQSEIINIYNRERLDVTDAFEVLGLDINTLPIGTFFERYYDDFLAALRKWSLSDHQKQILLPDGISFDKEVIMHDIIADIDEIKEDYRAFPENYKNESYNAEENNDQSVLDVLLSKGIFPTLLDESTWDGTDGIQYRQFKG